MSIARTLMEQKKAALLWLTLHGESFVAPGIGKQFRESVCFVYVYGIRALELRQGMVIKER